MAVRLRLRRMGKKRQPIYKVVAADARAPRDGRFIEAIGLYNPKTNPATIDIDEERAMYWLGVGAQPTITVNSLFSKLGINVKKAAIKNGLSEEEVLAKVEEWKKSNEAKAEKDAKKAEAKKEEAKKAEAKKLEEEAKKAEAAKAEEEPTEEKESEVTGTTSEESEASEEKAE